MPQGRRGYVLHHHAFALRAAAHVPPVAKKSGARMSVVFSVVFAAELP
jgi:hypothetical protein